MLLEKNKAVVRRFVDEVQNKHKLDVLDEVFSPDMVDHSHITSPPNRDGTKQMFAMMFSAFPDFTATIQDQVAEGDKVVTRKTFTGTHQGDYMGMPPTGKEISFEVIEVVRLVDGKITDHWAVGDMLKMMQQLGAIPAMA
ncbi:MAG: ester cyclase [Chloroflexi bacterium]|nr:ester cyclase [Chloroflexota bacterium]